MLKKDEVETLITNTVSNIVAKLETKLQEHVAYMVQEKTKFLEEKIESLEFENNALKENISTIEKKHL